MWYRSINTFDNPRRMSLVYSVPMFFKCQMTLVLTLLLNEFLKGTDDYLMSLDALDGVGEVRVEVELVDVHVFVLLGPWFPSARVSLLLLFSLQRGLGHRRLDGHNTVLTPATAREKFTENQLSGKYFDPWKTDTREKSAKIQCTKQQ